MEIKVILCVVFLPVVISLRCEPKYHFWKPYYGEIPKNAFVASTDRGGIHKYIAKVIVPDADSRTVPAELSYSDHIPFVWNDGAKDVMYIDKYIEIMCTEYPKDLKWLWINASADCDSKGLSKSHCLVEGGGWFKSESVFSPLYVARDLEHFKYYHGRTSSGDEKKMEAMDGWKHKTFKDNFQILSYPRADKAD